ncbi:MAG: MFS transporter [Pseudomonadota bacterium]
MTANYPEALSEQDRQYGLNALLMYTFFMVIGFTMLMPLVAVHFINHIKLAAALVGAALAARQLTQQGLALVGGILSDRFGARSMICMGVLLRALGFLSLGFANTIPILFVAMIITALGGALFEAPYQASIVALTTPANRSRYYSLNNWISGIASTLGPLVGVALLRFDFQIVCFVAAACFALNFLVALKFPTIRVQNDLQPFSHGLGLVKKDRSFIMLTLFMMGYWFASVQINISFPLMADRLTHSQDSIGIMFAVNAGLTVFLQYPLTRLLQRWLSVPHALILGIIILALGTGAIGFVHSFTAFLVCVALFSIGAVVVRPALQTLTASMANPKALGTFLGVSCLSPAVGGSIGNIAGGWLIEFANAHNTHYLPWFVFCSIALLSAFGLLMLIRFTSIKFHD